MASRALTVWGVEANEESVACAIENAGLNGITNAAFFAGEVGRSLEDLAERAGKPDVAVVDPPRAGLSRKALRRARAARGADDRLRLVQPDDARGEREGSRRRVGLHAAPRPAGRHVPAHAARRVRLAADAMRVALMIEGQEGVSWEQWLALARACEERGIEALFRSDHYQSVFGISGAAALDAWATLAALAAVTERVRLGTLVSPVDLPPPPVSSRSGRHRRPHLRRSRRARARRRLERVASTRRFGFPFPDLGERMDELEQQLETRRRASGRSGLAEGPCQQPGPPLILGRPRRAARCRLAAR